MNPSDQPALMGIGVADQRLSGPGGVEAVDLMAQAVERAALDAGSLRLLDRVGWIGVPEGMWHYGDPGRMLADRFGLTDTTSVRAEVGILQQDVMARALRLVTEGVVDVALVVGGEAKRRSQLARRAGGEAPETRSNSEPDEVIRPHTLGIAELEMDRGLVSPAAAFALIETALRARAGRSIQEHGEHLAALWARFGRVAADNPHAWDRSAPSAVTIRTECDTNRMIAAPYTRLMASQWNVDQSAALLFCTPATAQSLGADTDRAVFPHASTISDFAVPVSQRQRLDRSPGAEHAARSAFELAGTSPADIPYIDLYSCYPAVVQVYANELGIPLGRDVTVTGGMTFAGGPLNNYVLQALARLAELLRADPGAMGLSTSISGFLVKQGFGVWSTAPPRHGFRAIDATAAVAADPAAEPLPLDDEPGGEGTVVAYTVQRDLNGTPTVTAVVDLDDTRRTVATSQDDGLAASVLAEEWVGQRVGLAAGGGIEG